ncbi:DNA-binding CsgD family transcriptional regulator/tetratricopeptide (TPR) repeat protein [Hamadaea flava]|uniref:Helix-turn-helix transcriptional regulator n=1 Tax=Hamadaea flava TaxID=1742688 RepID=A0ABV8LZV2_9ACTN|nr:LuxR family transcriptional regulator [Hamadaea flava]MCP2328959.1 DNA-binding CsgD family transcriptional regulator/tetratricopeptide (TPR) repeat protein [Hamadaea flava]
MGREAAANEMLSGAAAVSPPALVGRDEELARLAEVVATPAALVLVEGEAGLGKTRLLEEFLTAADGSFTALTATCPPLREPCTLGPIVDAVLALGIGTLAPLELSPLAGALRPLFPEWAGELPPALEPAEDATAARHRVLRALAELVDKLGVTLLVVDDAQWSDDATREFMLFLANREGAGLSLVVAYRPEDLVDDSWLRRLSALLRPHRSRLRLVLEPLGQAETAALASSMLAGEAVSEGFARHLHVHTDGVPLAVEECVRLMAGRGDVIRHVGVWKRLPLEEIVVPPTVRDTVLEHAGQLTAAAQTVLRAAAVVAEPVAEQHLRQISRLSPDEFEAGIAEATAHRLLQERDRHRLSFRHVLAGRAIYDAIPERERRSLHERAGDALEALTPPPLAQLANHFRQAGDGQRWRKYAGLTVEVAVQTGDEATAGTVLYDVLINGDVPVDELSELADRLPLGSLTGTKRQRDVTELLRQTLGQPQLAPSVEADLRFQLARILNDLEDYGGARSEMERALPHLARTDVSAAMAMLVLGLPRGRVPVSEHVVWLDRAAEIGAGLPPSDRLRIDAGRAGVLLSLGDQRGWAAAENIPGEAGAGRDRRVITVGRLNVGHAALRWGRYAEASRWLADASRLAEEYEQGRLEDLILGSQLHLDWLTGNWVDLAEHAAALAGKEGVPTISRLEPALIGGLLHLASGRLPAAGRELERVVDTVRSFDAWEFLAEASAALTRIRLAEDRPDQAMESSAEACDVIADKGIWIWGTEIVPARVRALTAVGAMDEARDLIASFEAGLAGRDMPAPSAAAVECRAVVAEAQGEHASAVELYARAAGAWAALPRPYDAALAREHQARNLIRAGAEEQGLELLAEVLTSFAALPAGGDVDRVARTLREHGKPVPRTWRGGRKGYGSDLSPRELEVVELAAEGRTNQEIARRLHRSHHTVASQLKSAMRKLEATSRTTLTAKAIAAGVVAEPGTRDH